MRKILLASILALGLLLSMLSTSSMAACNSLVCTGYIQRLYFSNNSLYIATDGDESVLNCTAPANAYVTISTSDPMLDEKYALLLMAVSLKKPVSIRIVENDPACAIAYVFMDN